MTENNEEKKLRFRATLFDGVLLHVADAEYLCWNEVKDFVLNNKNIYYLELFYGYPCVRGSAGDVSVLDNIGIDIFRDGYFYQTTFDFLDIMHSLYKPTKDMFDYAMYISGRLNDNNRPQEFEEFSHDRFLRLEKKSL